MARKVRRVRRIPNGAKPASVKTEAQPTTEEELRESYAYVIKDLRRVAILAAAMFSLLIILNLLLR